MGRWTNVVLMPGIVEDGIVLKKTSGSASHVSRDRTNVTCENIIKI